MQDKLSRFTHRAHKQQEANQVGRVPVAPQEVQLRLRQSRTSSEDIVKGDAVGQQEQRKDTKGKAEVTDSVDHEGLDRGSACRRLLPVETDQQVRGHTHSFPAKEHLDKVVSSDQRQHGEGKEGKIREEAGFIGLALSPLRIMVHVAKAIEVHQRRDGGHDDQHDSGQAIEPDRPVGRQRTGLYEVQNVDLLHMPVEAKENNPAK